MPYFLKAFKIKLIPKRISCLVFSIELLQREFITKQGLLYSIYSSVNKARIRAKGLRGAVYSQSTKFSY